MQGTPGDLAFLLYGSPQSPLFASPIEGLFLGAPPLLTVTAAFGVITLGTVPPEGTLTFMAPLGAPPAGSEAATVHLQLLTLGAAGFELGEGSSAPLVDVGSIDCNGNGIHDAVDILTGGSCDMDGDGVPDECQVPFADPGVVLDLPDEWLDYPYDADLAASDDALVVGVPDVSVPGGSGVVLAYAVAPDGTMTPEAVLQASDPLPVHDFGRTVALEGDLALIGDPKHDHGAIRGAAFVFRRASPGTWIQEAELLASAPAPASWLGSSVSLSGSFAVVGAPGDDFEKGVVLVFRRDAPGLWVEEAVLTPSDALLHGRFGSAVEVDGDTIAVGGAESVYVFRRTAPGVWVEETKLDIEGLYLPNRDGWLALDGDVLAVGAPFAPPLPFGKVLVWRHSAGSWTLEATLSDPQGQLGNNGFGWVVDLREGTLVASSPEKDTPLKAGVALLVWNEDGAGTWTYRGWLGPIPSLPAEGNESLGLSIDLDTHLFASAFALGKGAIVSFKPIPHCP